jgi:hypothetical protein
LETEIEGSRCNVQVRGGDWEEETGRISYGISRADQYYASYLLAPSY